MSIHKKQHPIHLLIQFLKRETVLSISLILAVVSAFWVRPDKTYISYIDFRTLGLLFCLMSIVAGLKRLGVFDLLAEKMLSKAARTADLVLLLVLLCFFFSMFITNDVALITFVPFTLTILHKMPRRFRDYWMLRIVAMQTLAANLGSMLTPIGNPQNLYLYTVSGITPVEMLTLMLPYTAAALALLLVWIGLAAKKFSADGDAKDPVAWSFSDTATTLTDPHRLTAYLLLFAGCLLCVARLLPFPLMLALVLIYILLRDAVVLQQADYSLLATFTALFIFIGNLGRIPAFNLFLQTLMKGHEILTAVAASQVMSNVPAAILLSGFTSNYPALIVGTDIGGLGTLIASMASLISFKYIAAENAGLRRPYLCIFTASNLIFLLAMLGLLQVLPH